MGILSFIRGDRKETSDTPAERVRSTKAVEKRMAAAAAGDRAEIRALFDERLITTDEYSRMIAQAAGHRE